MNKTMNKTTWKYVEEARLEFEKGTRDFKKSVYLAQAHHADIYFSFDNADEAIKVVQFLNEHCSEIKCGCYKWPHEE